MRFSIQTITMESIIVKSNYKKEIIVVLLIAPLILTVIYFVNKIFGLFGLIIFVSIISIIPDSWLVKRKTRGQNDKK